MSDMLIYWPPVGAGLSDVSLVNTLSILKQWKVLTSPLYHGIGSFNMARGMMGCVQWGLTLRAVMLSVQLPNSGVRTSSLKSSSDMISSSLCLLMFASLHIMHHKLEQSLICSRMKKIIENKKER